MGLDGLILGGGTFEFGIETLDFDHAIPQSFLVELWLVEHGKNSMPEVEEALISAVFKFSNIRVQLLNRDSLFSSTFEKVESFFC